MQTGIARSSPSPTPTQSAVTARAPSAPRETSQPNNGATSKTVDAEERKMTEARTAKAEAKEDKKVEKGTGDSGRSAGRAFQLIRILVNTDVAVLFFLLQYWF